MLIRDVKAPSAHGDWEITLHPQVTILTGLGPDGQVAVADLLAAVIYGRTEGLSGAVEMEGNLLSLDQWAADVGQGLDQFDVFLRASDLPSAASPGSRAAVDPGTADALDALVERARRTSEAARRRLVEATDARAAAVSARTAAQKAVNVARVASARLAAADVVPDQAALAELQAKAAAALAEAEGAAARAEAALTDAEQRCRDATAGLAGAQARLAAARERRRRLEEARAERQAAEEQAKAERQAAAEKAEAERHAAMEKAEAELRAAEASARARRELMEERADAVRRAAQRAADAAMAATDEARGPATEGGEPASGGSKSGPGRHQVGYDEAVRQAEAALADAEAAAGAVADADSEVQRLRAELETARGDLAEETQATAADAATIEELRARVEVLDEELARARAEAALLSDFADSNAGSWREAPNAGDAGGGGGPGSQGAHPAGTDIDAATAAAATALQAEDEARQAERRLAELRDRAGRRPDDAVSAEARRAGLRERRERGQARLAELDETIATPPLAGGVHIEGVAAAADRLRTLPTPEQAAKAGELLVQVQAAIDTRAQFSVRAAPGWLVDDARAALEQARVQLVRAEEMAKPLRISSEDAAELEAAHQAVADAEARVDRRLSGPLARRRLEAALAVEKGILDRVGLSSYGAYLLRTMPIAADSDAAEKLVDARRAMADAEAVWAELQELELPVERAAIEEEEARLIAAATGVLPPQRMPELGGRGPAETLEAVRVALEEAAGAPARVADLTAALVELVPGDPPADDLVALLLHTDRWLEAAREDAVRRVALADERAALESELASIDADLAGEAGASEADELAAAERAAAQAWEGADAAAAAAREAATAGPGGDTGTAGVDVARVARATAEVDAARRHVSSLEAELETTGAALGRATARTTGGAESPVAALERRVADVEAELVAAESRLADARRRADDLADGAARLIGQVAAAEEQARRRSAAEGNVADAAGAVAPVLDVPALGPDGIPAEARVAMEADRRDAPGVTAAAADDEAEWADALEAERNAADEVERVEAEASGAAADAVRAGAELTAARATREAATAEAQRLEREVEAARRAAAGAQEAARSRAELEVAEAALAEAVAAEAAADREVAAATASVGAARDDLARAGEERAAARTADLPLRDEAGTDQDDEMYVLSRLANSRSVGRFGPVPVLLVEPFSRFGPARSAAVRDLLGRMSSAVQIIYLTEDSDVVTWARQIGQQRASVLRFGATADLRP